MKANSTNLSKTLVLNVDVQNAFGKKAQSDALRTLRKSEGSEVKRAAELSEAVYDAGGMVVVTKDWHNKIGTKVDGDQVDNRSEGEFAIFGEHAVAGSKDAELNARLEQTMQRLEAKAGQARTVIGVDQYDRTSHEGSSRLVEVHKNIYDVTRRLDLDGETRRNQSFIDLLSQAQKNGIETVIITGKIAEVCVNAAAESIKGLFPGLDVKVARDAVSAMPVKLAHSLDLKSKQQIMNSLAAQRVDVTTTERLLPSAGFVTDGILGK